MIVRLEDSTRWWDTVASSNFQINVFFLSNSCWTPLFEIHLLYKQKSETKKTKNKKQKTKKNYWNEAQYTFDFSSSCKLVEALRISILTYIKWHIHEHLRNVSYVSSLLATGSCLFVTTLVITNQTYPSIKSDTSIKSPSANSARQASRSFW